jgi:hypothetical protein
MRPEDAHRLAGLHQQRFVVPEIAQRADDGVKGRPVASRASGAAIDDQLIGLFGNLGIEVVHEHPQRRFLMPAVAGNLAAAKGADDRRMRGHYRVS